MKDTDKGFKDIEKLLKQLIKAQLKVGVLSDAGVNSETGEYIADYARINEYGAVTKDGVVIPERSYMRTTADEQKENWSDSMSKAFYAIIKDEGKNLDYHLSRVGEQVRNDIVLKISSNIAPKNAQSTIDKKGSDRTLVDTGILKQSIKYEIIK